jgi:hypothetical protein
MFVLAADLLQSLINKGKDDRTLRIPLEVGYTSDFLIVQYADDTLLTMEACPLQLVALRAILNTYTASTGLKVNYSKSCMYPINISEQRLNHLASTFSCQNGSMPFTYLGLPLSLSQPSI